MFPPTLLPPKLNHLAGKLKQPGPGLNKYMQYIYIFLFAGPTAHRWNFPSAPDARPAAGFHLNVWDSLKCVGENEYEKSSKLLQNSAGSFCKGLFQEGMKNRKYTYYTFPNPKLCFGSCCHEVFSKQGWRIILRRPRAPSSLEVSSCHHTQGLYLYDSLLKYYCSSPVSIWQSVNYGEKGRKKSKCSVLSWNGNIYSKIKM